MKFTYSKLSQAAFLIGQTHLSDYITHLSGPDSLYFYKADCKRIASSMVALLESAQAMQVPELARSAIRTVIELSKQAGNYSCDGYTGAVETTLAIIECELDDVIQSQNAARKQAGKKLIAA